MASFVLNSTPGEALVKLFSTNPAGTVTFGWSARVALMQTGCELECVTGFASVREADRMEQVDLVAFVLMSENGQLNANGYPPDAADKTLRGSTSTSYRIFITFLAESLSEAVGTGNASGTHSIGGVAGVELASPRKEEAQACGLAALDHSHPGPALTKLLN